MPVELGPPSDGLSQGDLLADVPSIFVEDLRYMVQIGEGMFQLRDEPQPRRPDGTYPANAREVRTFGVVMTHDCEIDKRSRRAVVYVALVRRLEAIPPEHLEGFRNNTRHRAFYLPPNEYLPGENYVDLRRMTPVGAEAIGQLPRLASMNDDGRRMLREHVFRFFSRHYLPGDWIDWPEDVDEA